MSYAITCYHKLYSCHEYNEKKRCPYCHCLETKKKGFRTSIIRTKRGKINRKTQRFICKSCHKSFVHSPPQSRVRYSNNLKYLIVKDYVTTKNSLSEVSNRYNITPTSILNWLKDQSNKYPDILSLNSTSKNSGIIQIDGKEIKIGGKRKVLLIGCDSISKEPFYYRLCNSENTKDSLGFLKAIKRVYKGSVRGIVSDFGRGKCFVGVVKNVFPNIPHQICLVHFLRYIWLFLPRTRRSQFYWRNKVLKWIIKKVITATTREESIFWLEKFKHWIPFFRAEYHKRYIKSLVKNYDLLTSYYDHDYLVTTTNIIENLNRQINRKLKNLDGFKSEKNIKPFLKIWFANYIINRRNRPL